ncbi:MAG TPA: YggS family pyridoxal phosphate-dependent enzyme [Puia sp.]|nr:YggS family pyridoxal phosphate-dependent enzyme [Puia sp.]
MSIDKEKYEALLTELKGRAQLVAVSKTKPVEDLQALYELGQWDFGENYVQELVDKQTLLPSDIRWHFIGHLQSNKVKYIAPFVHLIHGVDSSRLLKEIDKQAARNGRNISCLLQVHIAREETKFGLDEAELAEVMKVVAAEASSSGTGELRNVNVCGLMGMASFTEDPDKVRSEFHTLKSLFDRYFLSAVAPPATPPILSMGMSGDYRIAVEEGSNMVRIGSLLFGKRG